MQNFWQFDRIFFLKSADQTFLGPGNRAGEVRNKKKQRLQLGTAAEQIRYRFLTVLCQTVLKYLLGKALKVSKSLSG
jgi:hypothetical protein